MQASPAKIIDYFNGEKQNLVPLFQREYVWTRKQWQALWDDVMGQYEEEEEESHTHFMGAIVSLPARSVPVGVSKFLIIDGQQRLTTISLLLCALRDAVEPNSASRIQEVLLTNRFRPPEDTLKLVPTQKDREVYRRLVLDRQIPQNDSQLVKAYEFFQSQLSQCTDGIAVVPSKVLSTVENALQVVMINLGETDDPYVIFESLNFRGELLTQADLVRNYVMMRFQHSIAIGGEQERVYNNYWSPLEGQLKDKDEKRDNLSEFLRHYVTKDGENIKQGNIYAAMKTRLKDMPSAEMVEGEAANLQRFGSIYARFLKPANESEPSIRRRLENIQQLNITTAYPLLLRLFDARQSATLSDTELEKCLARIESFVVRRAICGVPTNSLNRIFRQWSKNFPSADQSTWLHREMSAGIGAQRFPSDVEFGEAFRHQPQYLKESTRFVLCRFEEQFQHREPVDLASPSVQVEHMLPQTLTPQWRQALGANPEIVHNRIVHTFGNLL